MKMKRLLKSKKAFSAIIASLILMLLAVAAGVVVYAYVMGWIGGATTNPRMMGKLSYDSIYGNATAPGKINVAVRNVGGTSLVLSDVYVQGANMTGNCTIGGAVLTTNPYNLTVQQVANLVINYTSMTLNSYYSVQVVCKDGTMISQSVQAQ